MGQPEAVGRGIAGFEAAKQLKMLRASRQLAEFGSLILKYDAVRNFGKEARRANITAISIVASAISSTFGPKGMDKMLLDGKGVVWISSDGATILNKVAPSHPAARIIADVAKAVDAEVGDGATAAVLLTSALVNNALKLLDMKIHPSILVAAYEEAERIALKEIARISTPIPTSNVTLLRKIVETTIASNLLRENREELAKMVVQAALKVVSKHSRQRHIDPADINVEKRIGGKTELIEGMVLPFHEVAHDDMPKRVENAKIAVLTCDLLPQRYVSSNYEGLMKLEFSLPSHLSEARREKEAILEEMVDTVTSSGANVVFAAKGIDPLAAYMFAQHGIMVVRRISPEDIERISKVVGAKVISFLKDLAPSDLGRARLVEERKILGREWTFIEEQEKAKVVTILLSGHNEQVLDEMERAIKDAVWVIKDTFRKPSVVPGGGACEIWVATKLRAYAKSLPGKRQFGILAYADALEHLVTVLSRNSALDPIDTLSALRNQIEKLENAGIDAFDGRVKDTIEAGIIEPLLVKEQIIKSATEAAVMTLRVDDYIAARRLEGSEKDLEQLERNKSSQHLEDIFREHRLDSLETDIDRAKEAERLRKPKGKFEY